MHILGVYTALSEQSEAGEPPQLYLKSNIIKRVAVGLVSAALVVAVVVGIITGLHYTTCPVRLSCDGGWQLIGTECYYFSSHKQRWKDSRATCLDWSGDLVKIESREEQRFLFDKVKELMEANEDKFWIGLTDAEREGEWKWTDGSPLNSSLTFWFLKENRMQPDNYAGENSDGEDCVRMGELTEVSEESEDNCWFDRDCTTDQKYICERKPTTSPDCRHNDM